LLPLAAVAGYPPLRRLRSALIRICGALSWDGLYAGPDACMRDSALKRSPASVGRHRTSPRFRRGWDRGSCRGIEARRGLEPGEAELAGEHARLVGEVEADVFERDPGGKYGVHGAAVEPLG
jgi:hypothetical protein